MQFKENPNKKLIQDKSAINEANKEKLEFETLIKMTDEEFIKDQKEELQKIEKIISDKKALTIGDIKYKNLRRD